MSLPPLFERNPVAPVNSPTRRQRPNRPPRLCNPAIRDARHEIQSLGRIDDEILTLADIPKVDLSPTSTNASYWANWCSCLNRFTYVTCICIVVYIGLMTAAAVMNVDRTHTVELVTFGLSVAGCILLTLFFDRGTYARAFMCEREPIPLCPVPIGVQPPEGEPGAEPPNDEAGVAQPQDPNFLMVPSRSTSRHSMDDSNLSVSSRSSSCHSVQDPNFLMVPSRSSSRHSIYDLNFLMGSSRSSSRHSMNEDKDD